MAYSVEDSELAYASRLSRLRLDRVRMPDGTVAVREVVERPDAVAVVPVDRDDVVVLLRQYRHPFGQAFLEVPAGILDVEGERPEDAARRELTEEAGLEATALEPLITFHNSAGWTDERTTLYLGTGLRQAQAPDGFTAEAEEADMEVVRMPLTEAVTLAVAGRVTDAKTVIGLLLAERRLGQRQT